MNYAVSARRALLGFKAAFTGGGKKQEQKKKHCSGVRFIKFKLKEAHYLVWGRVCARETFLITIIDYTVGLTRFLGCV